MEAFRIATGIGCLLTFKDSPAYRFFNAARAIVTPPLPEPLQFSPIRIRQNEPPQQRGESYDDYFNRVVGLHKDARGRLRSSDGRLSLFDKKNMEQYHREMYRFYSFTRGAYDMQAIRQKYSY